MRGFVLGLVACSAVRFVGAVVRHTMMTAADREAMAAYGAGLQLMVTSTTGDR